jgi:tetratricopeptide (TPR) repeat protein
MISRRIKRILIATAVLAAAGWWYARRDPVPPPDPETPAAPEAARPIADPEPSPASLSVPPEWMLSRSNYVAAVKTNAVPTNRPAADTPMTRILAPYARPITMLSAPLLPPMASPPESPGASALRLWTATEPTLDPIAYSYINKPSMLSKSPESLGSAWVTYTRRATTNLTVATAAPLAPLTTLVASEDPDALAKATFFIREAEAKVSAGLTDQAIAYYTQALTMFPRMTYANKQLGRLKLMRGEYDLAAQYLTIAIEGDDTPGETLNDLGIAHLYAGRVDQALAAFEAATTADAALPEPRFNVGLALRKGGRSDEARQAFNRYLALIPNDARAYRELAVIDALADQHDAAMQNLERAISIDPTWYTPRLDAALLHAERNEYDAALSQLTLALEHAPAWVVLQIYQQPPFHNLRLMPESRDFESRLAAAARKGVLP